MASKVLAAMAMGSDEFSFASTFSDDDVENADAASPITAMMGRDDYDDGSHREGVDIPSSAGGVTGLEGSHLPSAAAAEIMGTSPNTAMMNAPNIKDEFFMYQVRGLHSCGSLASNLLVAYM